jgi:hypothetical protein
MDDNKPSSSPSTPFVMKDLYKQQAEDLGLRNKVPAQTKLTLNEQGLGLRLSTGTQLDEDETPKKKKKSCFVVKSKARTKAKHTIASIMQHRHADFKQSLAAAEETEEDDDSKQAVMRKENDNPNTTTEDKNPNFAPPFVVDFLAQDQESVQSPSCSTATFLGGWESGGWTNTPENWVRILQARSTEGGADLFVDRHALGEVASSLFRDLASEFVAAKKCGNEFPM